MSARRDSSGQSDRPPADQPAMVAEKTDGHDISPVPTGLDTNRQDLGSPDALVRYRALDYREAKGNKAPLDPLSEAMEGDDSAVRANAPMTLEQYWAKQQERENR